MFIFALVCFGAGVLAALLSASSALCLSVGVSLYRVERAWNVLEQQPARLLDA